MKKTLILLVGLIFVVGMAIPAIAIPPAQFIFHDTGAGLPGDDKYDTGTVTITHAKTGKTMAIIDYKDTDDNGRFSFDVGPGGITVYDEVLSITNPGNVNFVGPGGPLRE